MAEGTRRLNCSCGSKLRAIFPNCCSKLRMVSAVFTCLNSSAIQILPTTKLALIASKTSRTRGMLSTREMSTVSICGQYGKPRSAITRVLVCRTRLNSELMAGFRIPFFSTIAVQGQKASVNLHCDEFLDHSGGAFFAGLILIVDPSVSLFQAGLQRNVRLPVQ